MILISSRTPESTVPAVLGARTGTGACPYNGCGQRVLGLPFAPISPFFRDPPFVSYVLFVAPPSALSALCPLPYSRFSSAFNPLICVIRDSDKLPMPFATRSPFFRDYPLHGPSMRP